MSALDAGSGSGANGKRRRRLWSEDDKRRIVAETTEPGASVSVVARRHDVNANMVFTWRREFGAGVSVAADATTSFIPAVIGPAPVAAPSPVRSSLASRMEIAPGGGIRVIVGADVD